MEYDDNGNPDVMGTRQLTPDQRAQCDELRLAFNALHAKIEVHASTMPKPEGARLFAISMTHLELACMAAIKGVSRS